MVQFSSNALLLFALGIGVGFLLCKAINHRDKPMVHKKTMYKPTKGVPYTSPYTWSPQRPGLQALAGEADFNDEYDYYDDDYFGGEY
jgi:hypothetical protein